MDAAIKQRWVNTLRSGRYEQARGALRIGNSFCCLGVLCDVANPKEWDRDTYLDQDNVLPETIVDAFQLPDGNPIVTLTPTECELVRQRAADILVHDAKLLATGQLSLGSLNDYGLTFDEIATIIEREL